jgi:glycosyltransferase involved in cell wall biosynthesis
MLITLIAAGGGDLYYELGLCLGVTSNGVHVDYIGSDSVRNANVWKKENVTFINLRGSQDPAAHMARKIFRILIFYFRLIKYAWKTDSKLFHIQWPNKFVHFDRIFLNMYYKMLGKKLVFTAHNVNAGIRDANDNSLNRFSLKVMYKIVDQIIVHTHNMKDLLIQGFGVSESKVAVIQYGINDMVFESNLTRKEARGKLGLDKDEKVALFFGNIVPYKGLEYLLMALARQRNCNDSIRLIIAGKQDRNYVKYFESIQEIIKSQDLKGHIIEKVGHIPDKDIEIYFKTADVLVLPYKYIFQSGVLFLAYNFGLPVIASDVGSLREFIDEGKTGFICKPENVSDLYEKMNKYFESDLFKNLDKNREEIKNNAKEKYSWEKIGKETVELYKRLV